MELPYLAIILIGLFIAAVSINRGLKKRNEEVPVSIIHSKILAKNTVISDDKTTTYFITFGNIDGKEVELEVENSEFEELNQGENGRLSYQGKRYINFDGQ